MAVCRKWWYHHMLSVLYISREKLGCVSFIIVQSYDGCKSSSTLWPVGHIRLFAHYTTSLSSVCRSIWRYWISKILVRYILSSVGLTLSQFSQVSFMQYMGLCVFGLSITLIVIVNISVLYFNIIIKSEVWPICHCLGLGHETMVCPEYFFFILMNHWILIYCLDWL